MSGWRPPSSLGNFACKLRKEDCASLSVFCEESCTTNPLAAPSEAGGMAAVRGRAGAAAGSPACGSSEIGARAGAAARGAGAVAVGRDGEVVPVATGPGAAGGAMPTGLPLASFPSGRMVTVRTFFGSDPAEGCAADPACPEGAGGAARGAESATGSSCLETSCSFSAVASRSWTALLDCGSPAVAGTILVGVEVSAAMTGGGWVELGTPE